MGNVMCWQLLQMFVLQNIQSHILFYLLVIDTPCETSCCLFKLMPVFLTHRMTFIVKRNKRWLIEVNTVCYMDWNKTWFWILAYKKKKSTMNTFSLISHYLSCHTATCCSLFRLIPWRIWFFPKHLKSHQLSDAWFAFSQIPLRNSHIRALHQRPATHSLSLPFEAALKWRMTATGSSLTVKQRRRRRRRRWRWSGGRVCTFILPVCQETVFDPQSFPLLRAKTFKKCDRHTNNMHPRTKCDNTWFQSHSVSSFFKIFTRRCWSSRQSCCPSCICV